MTDKKWSHVGLLEDLADHLARPERMMWMDMQLGPSGSPRPDVFTMQKSYSRSRPLAYEIKVTKSDFRSDITKGKWQSYLKYAQGVIFCVPAGLITKADLPAGCGLMVRGDTGWRTLKAPTLNPVTLPKDMLMKLVIDGVHRERDAARRSLSKYWLDWRHTKAQFSEDVAIVLDDLKRARAKVTGLDDLYREKHKAQEELLRRERDRQRAINENREEEAVRLRVELCGILGIPDHSTSFEISSQLTKLRKMIDADPAIASARDQVKRAAQYVNEALTRLGVPTEESA